MVIPLASSALVVSLSLFGLHPVAFTARTSVCHGLPANIHAADDLRFEITRLVARSHTLRAQCARIAGAAKTQVTVTLTSERMTEHTRARSTARRYQSGLLVVDIVIPVASQDFAELLAHELEHVTEFLDRIDFKALVKTGGAGVAELRSDGSFETTRAQKAGLAAAQEIEAATDPAVLALGRGLARAALALRLARPR